MATADKQVRCCIYARVSTEEQAERDLSIPFQLERCRYHAQGKGWDVGSEFVDAGESARTDRRPEFQKMISAARAKEFDVILVHKFDRFARNDYDFVVYEKELEDLGITLESVSEPGDASTPAGYIGRRMMQVISTWYSKNLAIEVKKGMLKVVENGGWPKPAPVGYINKRDRKGAWIEIDPEYGPRISKAFTEMASGKWTLENWANQAYSLGYRNKKGGRIRKQNWSRIFHNRFYLGETWLREGDVPAQGKHEPLVDPNTFSAVQEVLKEHNKQRQQTRRNKYLLRGLVYSLDADSTCWAETHPSRGISYYRSRAAVNGSQLYYNTDQVDSELRDMISQITISDSVKNELNKEIVERFANEEKGNAELEQTRSRLAKLKRMEKNLQQMALEEQISMDDFKEHRARIEAERARLQNELDFMEQRQRLVIADFEIALQLAAELDSLFEKGNFDEKRLLCETVFKRIYLQEGKISKVELNAPFGLIVGKTNCSGAVLNSTPGGTRTRAPGSGGQCSIL
jgi:site-specific DNA recombinase